MYWDGPIRDHPATNAPLRCTATAMPECSATDGCGLCIDSTWQTLATQVPVGIDCGLTGIPYWGTDIGGFVTTPELTGELFVRWFQFGAANLPLFRWRMAADAYRGCRAGTPASRWVLKGNTNGRLARRPAHCREERVAESWRSSRSARPFSNCAIACCPTCIRRRVILTTRHAGARCGRFGCITDPIPPLSGAATSISGAANTLVGAGPKSENNGEPHVIFATRYLVRFLEVLRPGFGGARSRARWTSRRFRSTSGLAGSSSPQAAYNKSTHETLVGEALTLTVDPPCSMARPSSMKDDVALKLRPSSNGRAPQDRLVVWD